MAGGGQTSNVLLLARELSRCGHEAVVGAPEDGETVLERYERYFERRLLDPERISVLPPSLWFEEFEGDLDAEGFREEIGGAKEVIDKGVSGHIVPLRNPDRLARAILEVLADRESARRMGQAGQAHIRSEFGYEKLVANHLAFYRRALEERRRGGP